MDYIKTIKEAFDIIKGLYKIDNESLLDNGEIYYMNGKNGTEFDFELNNSSPAFVCWYKNELGAIKGFIEKDKIQFYIYDKKEPMNSSLKINYSLTHGFNFDEIKQFLINQYDNKGVYNSTI